MRERSSRRRIPGGVVLAMGMVLSATALWQASNAAFTATTANPGNSWSTGTVVLNDDDGGASPMLGTAMFSSTAMKPTDQVIKCLNVTYTGTVDTVVPLRFYTATTTNPAVGGNTLGTYFTAKVEEGTGATGNGSCTGFSSTSTLFDTTHNQTGSPTAAMPIGTMADLTQSRTTYANSFACGWTPTTSSTTKSYKFTITFAGSGVDATDNTMEALQLITTFTWEAHSS